MTRDDKQRLFQPPPPAAPAPSPTPAPGPVAVPPLPSPAPAPRSPVSGFVSQAQRRREVVLHRADLQSWRCFWCGCLMTDGDPQAPTYRTLEHIVPSGSGARGVEAAPNLKAACLRCNNLRATWNIGAMERQNLYLKRKLHACETNLARLRAHTSGACLYCKLRYHVREWLSKWRAARKTAPPTV